MPSRACLRPLPALLLLALAACPSSGERGRPAGAADTAAATAAAEPLHVPGAAPDSTRQALRRLVYVPVYSHIYFSDGRRSVDLAATLSIRNTDPAYPLTVTEVRYYDTAGRLVRSYLAGPRRLGPLATAEFVVGRDDTAGGSGANFLVELRADHAVTEPIVEAVMIGAGSSAGLSFVSVGRTLERR